jgi:hypothetical protein
MTSTLPLRIPVSFKRVEKTIRYTDPKNGKEKRKSDVTKNEMMRDMLNTAVTNNHLIFRYVLADSWFSYSDNMLFIHKLQKVFIMDIKSVCLLQKTEIKVSGLIWTNCRYNRNNP